MDTETILNEVLKAVLAAAIPILAGYLVTFIQSKCAVAKAQANSQLAKDFICQTEGIILSAVQTTNQTFVDDLKKAGKFDDAAAKEAFQRTKDSILKVLPAEAKSALTALYGDLNKWLDMQIESTVSVNKLDSSSTNT